MTNVYIIAAWLYGCMAWLYGFLPALIVSDYRHPWIKEGRYILVDAYLVYHTQYLRLDITKNKNLFT